MPNIPQVKVGNTTYDIKDNGARDQISVLKSDLNNVAHEDDSLYIDAMEGKYHRQFLKISEKKSGFYARQSKGINTSSAASYFDPIRIIKGQSYTFYHVYGYFTTIFYDDGTKQSISDQTWTASDYRLASAPDNGWAYISVFDSYLETAAVVGGTPHYNGEEYYEGYKDFQFPKLQIPELNNVKTSINEINDFLNQSLNYGYQHLFIESSENGKYWNATDGGIPIKGNSENARTYAPVKLYAGKTYTFINVYGYFTLFTDLTNHMLHRLTDDTDSNPYTVTITPEVDCYAYVTKHTNYQVNTMLIDGTDIISAYVEGPYNMSFKRPEENVTVNIHVKKDGTGDYTSIVQAVNWANNQTGSYPINIYVHTGDYDILDELGGNDFISHISDSTSARQGLRLDRNNVNLIGVGYVIFRFEMPNTVTEVQSERVSCLNLREFSNEVKNLTLIAKNCRYVVHDEAQGVGNIVRKCENLRCIHKGNAEGLWQWTTVWGGGTAKSGTYNFVNCQFLTSSYHRAWYYHSNYNTESLFFNIDGCIGSVKDSEETKQSFILSYYGTGRTGIETGNIKNCSGNGDCVVIPESGSTMNNIEMYVNGWEDIAEIPVTGNE